MQDYSRRLHGQRRVSLAPQPRKPRPLKNRSMAEELKQVADLITANTIFCTKEVLTSDEAAKYMGVSKSYLYKLTMRQQIPHYKPMGKMCYFNRLELEPNIRYYARLEDCTGNGKTPKYVITAQAGYYPPMDEIVSRDGKIYMYLQVSKDSGSKKDNQLYRTERLLCKRAVEWLCLWLSVGGKDLQQQAEAQPVF